MTVKELKEQLNNLVDVDDYDVIVSTNKGGWSCSNIKLFVDHEVKTLHIDGETT